MSKFGTYKVVGGKVVQVAEAEKYEPKPIPKTTTEVFRELAARKPPRREHKLYTGLYL